MSPSAPLADGGGRACSCNSIRTTVSAQPPTPASRLPPAMRSSCSTPTPSSLTTASRQLARVALERRELCGPRIVNPDGSLQASASGPPVGLWPWLRAAVPAGAGPRWAVERLHPSALETATEVSWLTGCCIAGPRDVLMGLGPFDPAIHMYGEDMDLCIRARIGGVRVAMRPELCQVIHYGKASSERVYGDLGREEAARNGRAVLRRAYGSRREWFAWMAERLSVSARAQGQGRAGARCLLGAARGRRPSPGNSGAGAPGSLRAPPRSTSASSIAHW